MNSTRHYQQRLSTRLESARPFWFNLFAIMAAFATYSCMYAFRKPLAVATFTDQSFFGVDYKILLLTAQVIGYTLSKFLGIKLVSELKAGKRAFYIFGLISIAALSLLLFAIVPKPWNILLIFINGIPLGMIWGLVFGYLEGRRHTEILGAGLSISFIFSSGLVKTMGKSLMLDFGISEEWMPFWTGMIFFLPLIVFLFLLDAIPPPNKQDVLQRTERKPMTAADRRSFIRLMWPGLLALILVYLLLTALRDFRDNFAAEIWESLGFGDSSAIFTATEIPVALIVLVVTGSVFLVKDNTKALFINHLIIGGGLFLAGVGTLAFNFGLISPFIWMSLLGLGFYAGYIPFNSMLFDRLIAAFKTAGNVGFFIYLADSIGYLGSVGVMLYKNFGQAETSWIVFTSMASYFTAIVGCLGIFCSYLYFKSILQPKEDIISSPVS